MSIQHDPSHHPRDGRVRRDSTMKPKRVSRSATPPPRASRHPSIRRRTSVNPDKQAPAPEAPSPSYVQSSTASQSQQSSRPIVQPAPDSPQPSPASCQASTSDAPPDRAPRNAQALPLTPELAYRAESFRKLDNEDRRHNTMRSIMEIMLLVRDATAFDDAERDPVAEGYTILRGLVNDLETLDNNAVVCRRRVAEAQALAEMEGYM
jgi:hypothetical protein